MRAPRLNLVVLLLAVPLLFMGAQEAWAAASMSVSAASSLKVGETITITVGVNTGGASANAYQASFSYPAGLFEAVRGTYSGSICTLPIVQPDPSGGNATISCGSPSGFTGSGTVATIVLKATNAGGGSFGLSGCSVLANDGMGTDITGGCSGRSITVENPPPAATPAPTAAPTEKPAAQSTPVPTPKPTVAPSKKPAEAPSTPAPTPASTPPPVQALPATTPTPPAAPSSSPGANTTQAKEINQHRTVAQAFSDTFTALKGFGGLRNETTGVVALTATLLPFLALVFGILLLTYRLHLLERRRKRTLDRLFEMELSELAALEAKMDILTEHGSKGREEYREEFRLAKEKILREVRPDYAKPVDPPAEQPPKQS